MPAKRANIKKYYTYPNGDENEGASLPLVSVILPIYNTATYLDQAIESVRYQTYRNLEILCINDGSTDDSLAIMQKHAAADSRIIVIDKENQGYGASCNRGIEESHGEWISIVEPDDWIEPTMYEDMLDFAKQFTENIDIVKTPYWRIYHADMPSEQKLHCSYKYKMHPDHQPFTVAENVFIFHHHPSIWSAIYRKSFLEENDIRFKPIPGAGWADNPFLAETLLQAKNIVYLDQAYYCYREDTKEKTHMFHKGNYMVPFDRWNEMMDVIERLGVTDERILCAHYSRGFMYAGGVLEVNDPDDPTIYSELTRMFSRMNPDLVFNYPYISPTARRLFAEIRGLEMPKINHVEYAENLVKQGFFSMRSYGIKQAFIRLGDYFQNYAKRGGGR